MILTLAFLGLGGYTWFKALTLPGKIIKEAETAGSFLDKIVREGDFLYLKKQMRLGINDYQEWSYEDRFGSIEPLLPVVIEEGVLPAGFGNLTGSYVWKVSEWLLFQMWAVNIYKRSRGEIENVVIDGRWLLEIGRKRWEDDYIRGKALEAAKKYSDVLSKYGMWPPAKSS